MLEEYPGSEWARGSGEKLRRIEVLVRRYSRILEFFASWNTDRMEEIRDYHRLNDVHGALRESISPEEGLRWGS